MYFLGIDTLTTSSKGLLMDKQGNLVAVASNPHTLQTPKPFWSEQDLDEWRGVSMLCWNKQTLVGKVSGRRFNGSDVRLDSARRNGERSASCHPVE